MGHFGLYDLFFISGPNFAQQGKEEGMKDLILQPCQWPIESPLVCHKIEDGSCS